MSLRQSNFKLRLALLLGAATGLAAGCVVSFGPGNPSECGGTFSNSEPQDDGTCACDAGYDWCNPGDENDFECCELDSCVSGSNNHVEGDSCACDAGYEWCDPSDASNLDCCEIPGGETGEAGEATSGDGDGDGDGDTSTSGDDEGTLPPETCSMDEEGASWCTKDDGDDPAGSRYFFCMDGLWVEDTTFMDLWCVDGGEDFAYGCGYDGTDNLIYCGSGPGTACTASTPAECADTDIIHECISEKLTATSCQTFCENGLMNGLGEDFEFGECEVVDSVADCSCYNSP